MDLRDLFTTNGFLSDHDGDGWPDAWNVRFVLEDGIQPIGLWDVFARMGQCCTELNLDTLWRNTDAEWEWCFRINSSTTSVLLEAEKQVKRVVMTAPDVESMTQALQSLASWSGGHAERISHIQWCGNDMYFNGQPVGTTETEVVCRFSQRDTIDATYERPHPMTSLVDLWRDGLLYSAGRVDEADQHTILLEYSDQSSSKCYDVFRSMAVLGARIGLYANGLRYPISSASGVEPPDLTFRVLTLENGNQSSASVTWDKDNHDTHARVIKIEGSPPAVTRAVNYLSKAKTPAEGGDFGDWEKIKPEKPDFPLLWEVDWQDAGEKAELEDYLDRHLPEWLNGNKEVVVEAWLSEPAVIRGALEDKYRRLAKSIDCEADCSIRIRHAYKPGYFRLEEDVVPELHRLDVKKIRITCKRASSEGMELSTRWLQEIYPIDELWEKREGWAVELDINDEQDETYVVTAFSASGKIIYTTAWSDPVFQMPYVDGQQYAYPTTGGVKVRLNDNDKRWHRIPTDRERFWTYYLDTVLPEVASKTRLSEKEAHDIVFARLKVDATFSEEEQALPVREERISSGEALHEDIYFNTLDFFHYKGLAEKSIPWDRPGSVEPFIHINPGAPPKASIKLWGWIPYSNAKITTSQLVFHTEKALPICITVVKNGIEETYNWDERPRPEWDPPVIHIDKQLASDQRLNHWNVTYSFEGRTLPVWEWCAGKRHDASVFRPSRKQTLIRPTVLIEAGHHGNEVSSMPAVQRLFLTLQNSHLHWLKRINWIVIPVANPDGCALHQKLVKEHPHWKHHAARCNAVGLEFSDARFQETIFGEADVLPRLFHRWLPDVYVDNHGIPSHEWTQPFAGTGSPPRFNVSYWMPSAQLYGISRTLPKQQFPKHDRLLNEVITTVRQAVNSDPALSETNAYWRKRYITYGHRFEPEAFPISNDDSMNFFHLETIPTRRSRSLIARFPQWVAAELISETCDETVTGEALKECIHAQQVFNRSVIRWLAERYPVRIHHANSNGIVTFRRIRPMNQNDHE